MAATCARRTLLLELPRATCCCKRQLVAGVTECMERTERRHDPDHRTGIRPALDVARDLHQRNQLLLAVAALNAVLSVLFAALMLVDGRTILGRNVWTKPWKFATSIAVFTATMGWILPSLSLPDRLERRAVGVIAATMTVEIALISTQAARGVKSHFNTGTLLDTAIFGVMGATVTVNTLVVAYVLWRVLQDPPPLSRAYQLGLRLGLLAFVVASLEGFLMVAQSGHAVGAPDDAPGLPLVNWSLAGGDLRVAHFVGLHALQVLPLTGYLAARWRRLSTRGAVSVVGAVAAVYGTLAGAVFLQALRGTPLLASVPAVSLAAVFGGSFLLVAPFWALMILAPAWRGTERVLGSRLVALPAALLYAVLLVPQFGVVAGAVLDPSLADLASLLATDAGATLAWAHFLAFDLFVGRWVYLDARGRGVSPLLSSSVLGLTLLFGPVGLLAYWVVLALVDPRRS